MLLMSLFLLLLLLLFVIPPVGDIIKVTKVKNVAGVTLVQFGGDRNGAPECDRIVTLDHQWDSLKDVLGFTWVSWYTCQSAIVNYYVRHCKLQDIGCVVAETKDQWARDDPAFLVLLSVWLFGESCHPSLLFCFGKGRNWLPENNVDKL